MELSAKSIPITSKSNASPDHEQDAQSRQLFQKTSLDVWHLYKQSMRACEASYLQGKEDAFEEVLKYLLMQNKNGDFRFVPITEFINFIRSKYSRHRSDCEMGEVNSQQVRQSSESRSEQSQLHYTTQEIESAIKVLSEQAEQIAKDEGPITQV